MSSVDTPLVSVVIPTYNHADFLREALASVLAQSEQQWEALIINNYSSDHTHEVVSSFSDARIKLVDYRNDGIIATSRNIGIKLAKGQFVAFLDSDDRWTPGKLRQCLDLFGKGADVVCHAERWFGDGMPARIVRYGPSNRGRFESLLYDGNALSTSAVVVRREHLVECGGFSEDPSIVTAEDYDLWLRLARDGKTIVFLDEVLGEYRVHPGGQSRVIERNLAAELAVLDRMYIALPTADKSEVTRRARRFAIAHYGAARSFQRMQELGAASRHLMLALRLYPWLPKLWAAIALNIANNLRA
jgi:glycosyltransferase involved in cell wall biosynthesis